MDTEGRGGSNTVFGKQERVVGLVIFSHVYCRASVWPFFLVPFFASIRVVLPFGDTACQALSVLLRLFSSRG